MFLGRRHGVLALREQLEAGTYGPWRLRGPGNQTAQRCTAIPVGQYDSQVNLAGNRFTRFDFHQSPWTLAPVCNTPGTESNPRRYLLNTACAWSRRSCSRSLTNSTNPFGSEHETRATPVRALHHGWVELRLFRSSSSPGGGLLRSDEADQSCG